MAAEQLEVVTTTVIDARVLRVQLEERILRLIQEFERITSLTVTEVNTVHIYGVERPSVTSFLSVTVEMS